MTTPKDNTIREMTIKELLNITIREAMAANMSAGNMIENTEIVFNNLLEAKLTAIKKQLPEHSKIGKQYSTNEIDRISYDFAYNQCLDEVTAIIDKELK